jgi:hypothetical protein
MSTNNNATDIVVKEPIFQQREDMRVDLISLYSQFRNTTRKRIATKSTVQIQKGGQRFLI